MQTYFEVGPDNCLQLVGKLIKSHSKSRRYTVEELCHGYVSVCTKLGAQYIDSHCRPNEVPAWTLTQIDSGLQETLRNNPRQKQFVVMKDGASFCFTRQEGTASTKANSIMSEFHLDQVILRVKILPEKHKTIKLPLHFYGELVKTKPGA